MVRRMVTKMFCFGSKKTALITLMCLLILFNTCMVSGLTRYSRCELANELNKNAFFRLDINNWVCLIENESKRKITEIKSNKKTGHSAWGLFQISDREWCKPTTTGGKCNLPCITLLTDDGISNASQCVIYIFKRHGFAAWDGWVQHCKDKKIANTSKLCNL